MNYTVKINDNSDEKMIQHIAEQFDMKCSNLLIFNLKSTAQNHLFSYPYYLNVSLTRKRIEASITHKKPKVLTSGELYKTVDSWYKNNFREIIYQKLSKCFPYIRIEDADFGEIWKLDNKIRLCLSWYGQHFKSERDFYKKSDAICYIGENEMADMISALKDILIETSKDRLLLKEKINDLSQEYGYSYQDILECCNFQHEVAVSVFDSSNWADITTTIQEDFMNDELAEYADIWVLTQGMELEDYAYECYIEHFQKDGSVTKDFLSKEEFLDTRFKDQEYMKNIFEEKQQIVFEKNNQIELENEEREL